LSSVSFSTKATTESPPVSSTTKVALAAPFDGPRVTWHPPIKLPAEVLAIFASADLYMALCDDCQLLQHAETDSAGALAGVFCARCRAVLGRQPSFLCPCAKPRFVDSLGRVTATCRDCHRRPQKRQQAQI
jgi:hypothetical protein